MAIRIDPRVDFVFKLMIGNPKHRRVTVHFLNALLKLKVPIVSVEILNPLIGKDRSEEKIIILDVLAKDALGPHLQHRDANTHTAVFSQPHAVLQLQELPTSTQGWRWLRKTPSSHQHLHLRQMHARPISGCASVASQFQVTMRPA